MLLIRNISRLYTLQGPSSPRGGALQGEVTFIERAAVGVEKGRFVYVGDEANAPEADQVVNAQGAIAIPAFVDPHTHLVYAGCRHEEYEMRLRGASYVEILKAGGGILQTVRATRAAGEEELLSLTQKRMDQAIRYGTGGFEIKSGYALEPSGELRMLQVARKAGEKLNVPVSTTFLMAHAFPPEYRNRREAFIQAIIEALPYARPYADFCDVFVDEGAFTPEEGRAILIEAKRQGFQLKIHADELTSCGGAELAGELGAVSADHLTYPSLQGLEAMKEAGTIAVLLPATTFILGKKDYAPARKMIEMGIPVALATDHNPGTSPVLSMPFVFALAVNLLRMTPEEALVATTVNAAWAAGLENSLGIVAEGRPAFLLLLRTHALTHLAYEAGTDLIWGGLTAGRFWWRKT